MHSLGVLIYPFLTIVCALCDLAYFVVVVYVFLSFLFAFRILNYSHERAFSVYRWLDDFLSPAMNWIRRWIPTFKMVDVVPLGMLLIILFVRTMVTRMMLIF